MERIARNRPRGRPHRWNGAARASGGGAPNEHRNDREGRRFLWAGSRSMRARRRREPGLDAHRLGLRVLDLHAQRHRHVLRAVRRLRGPVGQTAGGPSGSRAVQYPHVFIETGVSVVSSFTCGLGSVVRRRRQRCACDYAGIQRFVLGAAFLFIEISEFAGMVIAQGRRTSRSAFLSAFFALVGSHGPHVTLGLLWLV